jgi:hypothetical protein
LKLASVAGTDKAVGIGGFFPVDQEKFFGKDGFLKISLEVA